MTDKQKTGAALNGVLLLAIFNVFLSGALFATLLEVLDSTEYDQRLEDVRVAELCNVIRWSRYAIKDMTVFDEQDVMFERHCESKKFIIVNPIIGGGPYGTGD